MKHSSTENDQTGFLDAAVVWGVTHHSLIKTTDHSVHMERFPSSTAAYITIQMAESAWDLF